jgi:hypothetical protein
MIRNLIARALELASQAAWDLSRRLLVGETQAQTIEHVRGFAARAADSQRELDDYLEIIRTRHGADRPTPDVVTRAEMDRQWEEDQRWAAMARAHMAGASRAELEEVLEAARLNLPVFLYREAKASVALDKDDLGGTYSLDDVSHPRPSTEGAEDSVSTSEPGAPGAGRR